MEPEEVSGAPPADPSGPDRALLDALDVLDEAVVLVDPGGTVRRANARARDLLGDPRPGRPLASGAIPPLLEAAQAGRATFDADHGGRRVTGRRHVLPGGYAVWVARDVTAERAREDALLEERTRKAFLARTGRVLSGTLNLRRAWALAARLTADELADQAAVTLWGDNGRPETAVSRHGETSFRLVPPGRGVTRVHDTGRLERHDAVNAERARELCPPEMTTDGPAHVLLVPLTARGVCRGVLTLLRARPFGDGDLDLVREHADRVALALEAARLYEHRADAAGDLRQALRPRPLPQIPGVRLGAVYRPAPEESMIGGDFYDVLYAPGHGWLLALGDVCGKGVSAAVYTAQVRQALHTAADVAGPLTEALDLINRTLLITDDSRFVTLVLARLSALGDGMVRVDLASGGHPPPVVVRRDGTVRAFTLEGAIVGALPDVEFEETSVMLDPGDALYLYTDGIVEARGPDREMFGAERLHRALARYRGAPPTAAAEWVAQRALAHLGSGEHDDMAILGVQAWPPGHRMHEEGS
ncbi:SpoIIE family protein phosphatase [Actinomadura kijaniata]|uniref:SpoIIE family protein phosphatase n=1 Tax=Actinomadura kijaniata TaxID=46161 RepID=UPI000A0318EB|nr:SpoIIE family protein phosphatase [Actinomadura kijaniata]